MSKIPITKIIATLGPASSTETVIRNMILSGLDVCRLNFSHGDHSAHQRRLDIVRTVNQKYRRKIKILQDLEGNRIRVGRLKDGQPLELKKGAKLWLVKKEVVGNLKEVQIDYDGSFLDIHSGAFVFIDDGNIRLKIKQSFKDKVLAEVVIPGALKEHKGVNIPHSRLKFPRVTEKDKQDIQFGINNGVEYIAQSFVQDKYDCRALKKLFRDKLPGCKLVAKIECRPAVRNIDEIIAESDVIMVARGDMGVCLPIWEVPLIQKMIIRKCNQKRKPVITATQMLESMTESFQPTRAEVADVANAVLDGTDFVMLSAETAAGAYPIESVRMMNQIIKHIESAAIFRRKCC